MTVPSRHVPIYALVLAHTLEVGHGWGKTPPPLAGFYVLDRLLPEIENGAVDERLVDDEDYGDKIPESLKAALEASTSEHAAVQFVPRFFELVDLDAPGPVHVRDKYGFVALGRIADLGPGATVGVFFYAGGRWSRWNRYELSDATGNWAITKFQTLQVS